MFSLKLIETVLLFKRTYTEFGVRLNILDMQS